MNFFSIISKLTPPLASPCVSLLQLFNSNLLISSRFTQSSQRWNIAGSTRRRLIGTWWARSKTFTTILSGSSFPTPRNCSSSSTWWSGERMKGLRGSSSSWASSPTTTRGCTNCSKKKVFSLCEYLKRVWCCWHDTLL